MKQKNQIKNKIKDLTVGEMQKMYDEYAIMQFNNETKKIEPASTHTITTAELLRIIKHYEHDTRIIYRKHRIIEKTI